MHSLPRQLSHASASCSSSSSGPCLPPRSFTRGPLRASSSSARPHTTFHKLQAPHALCSPAAAPRRRSPVGLPQQQPLLVCRVTSKESMEKLPDPQLTPEQLSQGTAEQGSPNTNGSSNGAATNGTAAGQTDSENGAPLRWDKGSITASMDYDFLWSRSVDIDCKFGGVAEIIRKNERGLLTCSPGETLEGIIPKLTQVTGMPVVNDTGRVVGVISRKDIIRVRKQRGSMKQRVSKVMTSPAFTIPITASVQEAADLMLEKKIRRVPVVDAEGLPVGIIARSDIFKPLFYDQYVDFMSKELEAMQGAQAEVEKKKKKKITWKVKYLYDGDCAMCQSLKNLLERQDNGRNIICFVNIAEDNYNPKRHMGITYEDAMDTIHVIRNSGEVLTGTDALKTLFYEVGLGWVVRLTELPIVTWIVERLYDFLSANRLSLGGVGDAIIAAKRMEMSKEGKDTCADMDDECAVENWI